MLSTSKSQVCCFFTIKLLELFQFVAMAELCAQTEKLILNSTSLELYIRQNIVRCVCACGFCNILRQKRHLHKVRISENGTNADARKYILWLPRTRRYLWWKNAVSYKFKFLNKWECNSFWCQFFFFSLLAQRLPFFCDWTWAHELNANTFSTKL